MIKVNLLRSRGGGATTTKQFEYETSVADNYTEVSSGNPRKDMIMKVLVLISSTALLYAYESYNIGQLSSRLGSLNHEKNALAKEIKEKQPIAEQAKKMQKEIQDLEARIKAIKDLAKFRLREIKAVDYIQNVIPERVWLHKINIKSSQMKLDGSSLSEDQLNKFLDALESKAYFKNVILLKAVEQKSKDGTLKSFEISSEVLAVD